MVYSRKRGQDSQVTEDDVRLTDLIFNRSVLFYPYLSQRKPEESENTNEDET